MNVRAVTLVICAAGILLAVPLSRAQAPPTYAWTRSGRSRCRTSGSCSRSRRSRSTATITCGCSIAHVRSGRTRTGRRQTRRAPIAASRDQQSSSSIQRATWFRVGAARGTCPAGPTEQTINVDRDGNVWISGTGRGESILKFSRDGKLLKDFGHRPPPVPPGQTPPPLVENNQQTDVFISGVAGFDFDEDAREAVRRRHGVHQQADPRVRHGYRRVQARLGRKGRAAQRDPERARAAV